MKNTGIYLKQILNYRRLKLYEGELELAKLAASGPTMYALLENQLKSAKTNIENDGHSGGSYYWVKSQSIKIDEIGFKKWLETKDAHDGYSGIGIEIDIVNRRT